MAEKIVNIKKEDEEEEEEEEEEELEGEDDELEIVIPQEIFHQIFVWFICSSHPGFYTKELMKLKLTCKFFKLLVERIVNNEEKYLPRVYHLKKPPFRMDDTHTYHIGLEDVSGPFTCRFCVKKFFGFRQSSVDILTSNNAGLKIRQFNSKYVGYTRFGGYDKSFKKAHVDNISSEEWTFVIWAFDGDIMSIYINDEKVDEEVIRGGILPLSQLGSRAHELRYSFFGPIMEMTVFSECLSEEDIRRDMFELPRVGDERRCRVIGSWFFPEMKERVHGENIIEVIEYEKKK